MEVQYAHSRTIEQLKRSSKMVQQLEQRGFGLSYITSAHQATAEDDFRAKLTEKLTL